jgi:DNA ligase-1
MSLLRCEYHGGGVCLPALGLWLDAREPQPGPARVFVSHAHSDHIADHREVILSDVTAHLLRARIPGDRREHRLPWRTPHEFSHEGRAWRITLVPAGHMFGSAMGLIEAGGESLLYTGDFKLRKGLSAERCEPVHADTLIIESTYGRSEYVFPPTAAVLESIARFCREALDNDETPVLLGYSLGKSQEVLQCLAQAGLALALHPHVATLTRIYEQCGQVLPEYEVAHPTQSRGRVILCPPGINVSAWLKPLGPIRQAVLTGWAVDPNCRYRYQADAAFPLSDHADYPDLMEFVRRVNPKRILTLHGFAADFAASLRARGWDACALSQDEQLGLPLTLPSVLREKPIALSGSADPPIGDGGFAAFAEVCLSIGATTSKLEKTARLAAFLGTLAPDSLPPATRWFAGRATLSPTAAPLQVGWAAIRDAVCGVAGVSPHAFHQIYLRLSDLGESVHELFSLHGRPSRSLSIAQVAEVLSELALVRGPALKVPRLAALLGACNANEARYLLKILTGELRIGLREGLVEEAIAIAFDVSPELVRRVHLLTGDLAETARLASERRLSEVVLEPFRPFRVMLASPEPTAEAIWERVSQWHLESNPALAPPAPCRASTPESASAFQPDDLSKATPPEAWVEDKYDGVRCQLHRVKERIVLYSRDLKEVTHAFAEVARAAARLSSDVVLDGELVAMRDGRALPFAHLQRRLGRREADLFLNEEVPVTYVIFDLLWIDGRPLMDEPLRVRRARLEGIETLPDRFALAHVIRIHEAFGIEREFLAARSRGNEGLLVKDPDSPYLPGRRGLAWLKLKKTGATLDCVVIGVEYGHGKRRAVLSDYTFAVRDADTGELRAIGKAYSGLTDVEIERLTRHFLARIRQQHGRYLEVVPDVVLEIAFDRLQPSSRHASGLAMRFPRIVRIREDKTPAEIDTVQAAWRLVMPSEKP